MDLDVVVAVGASLFMRHAQCVAEPGAGAGATESEGDGDNVGGEWPQKGYAGEARVASAVNLSAAGHGVALEGASETGGREGWKRGEEERGGRRGEEDEGEAAYSCIAVPIELHPSPRLKPCVFVGSSPTKDQQPSLAFDVM